MPMKLQYRMLTLYFGGDEFLPCTCSPQVTKYPFLHSTATVTWHLVTRPLICLYISGPDKKHNKTQK